MAAVTVTLANRSYALRRGTSVRRLEKRFVAAVRRGAGFVRLRLASGPEVHALVSPSTPVTIEFTPAVGEGTAAPPADVAVDRADAGAIAESHDVVPVWMDDRPLDWLDLERELQGAL